MIFYTNWFLLKRFSAATWCSPFIFIRPSRKGDVGLLEHEKVHVKQFWRNPLMCFWYVLSKKARFEYEVEAYKVQATHNPEKLEDYAEALATKYGLNITKEQALAALKG